MKFEEIKKLKWTTIDHEFALAKISCLEGFSGDTNPYHHNIAIVSEVKPIGWSSNRRRVVRSIEISCGPYGESGTKHACPVGTTLSKAKEIALNLVERLIESGKEFKL